MKVEDFYVQNRRGWVRLHEKGGKVTELPCHHNLDQYLEEWITAAELVTKPESPLFPTPRHGRLSDTRQALPQANVHAMIQRRSKAAGLRIKISALTFGRQASPRISRMAASSRSRRPWPATKVRGQQVSMTGAAMP